MGRRLPVVVEISPCSLWDAETGELKRTLTGHLEPVMSVAFNPVSGVLASGSRDGTVLVWKVD